MKAKVNIDMEEMYATIDELIKKGKIKFNFYNGPFNLELLQSCYNKKDDRIEFYFRDEVSSRIEELKELTKKIEMQQKN